MVYLGFPLYKNALKSNKDKKKAKIDTEFPLDDHQLIINLILCVGGEPS